VTIQSFQNGMDDLVAVSALIFTISLNKEKQLRMFSASDEEQSSSLPPTDDHAVPGAESYSRLSNVHLPGGVNLSCATWLRGSVAALEALRSAMASSQPRGALGAQSRRHPSVDLFLHLSGRVLTDGNT
jgi:hypothetical protein